MGGRAESKPPPEDMIKTYGLIVLRASPPM